MSAISVLKSLDSLPIVRVPTQSLKLLTPSVFERVKIPNRKFLRSCQFGIIHPLIVTNAGEIVDGNRRFMACKVWSHESVNVKVIEEKISRESIVRLAIFLNGHRKRSLAANVGDKDQYVDPIPVPPDDLETRLKHARSVIEWRIRDDIAYTKLMSRRRAEFSADYEQCVESAMDTVRSLQSFCNLWDKEPPLPLAAARKYAADCVWQLSLCQNSSRREVLKG